MPDPHPLVLQLRFTRREFLRGVRGVSDADGAIRLGPMNCIAWNVGHLAWQEQRYFVAIGQERTPPYPEVAEAYEYGAPGSTPRLRDTVAAWKAITAEADPWLDTLTSELLAETPVRRGKPSRRPSATGSAHHLPLLVPHRREPGDPRRRWATAAPGVRGRDRHRGAVRPGAAGLRWRVSRRRPPG